jgi:Tol biopolymer transport system component/DNA-binding winged helix-turn-helix (wHTH) protein
MENLSRYTFGQFEFDQATFRLLKSGIPVPAEPKTLDVLQVLLARAPRMVDKAEIFSIVWKDVAVTDNALTRAIAQLRKALEDDSKAPRYIETVATRGYRFVADVSEFPAHALPTSPRPFEHSADTVPTQPGPSVRPRLRGWTAVAATMLVGLIAWAALPFVRPQAEGSRRSSAEGEPDIERLATLRPRQLTSGTGFDGFLTFSPDGTRMAFSSDRSGALETYVQSVSASSTPVALTSNRRHNVQPVWSPDGQFVAYHEMAGNGIWVVPSTGGTAQRVSDFGANPTWSPDGTKLAFQSLPLSEITPLRRPGALSTIWIVDMIGRGRPTAVTIAGTPAGPHLAPAWLPDSKHLLFAVPSSPAAGGATSLWRVEIEQRVPAEVIGSEGFSADFAIVPDGRGLYFVGKGNDTVWWMPLTADGHSAGPARPTGLPTAGSIIAHLRISVDGRRLAWTVLDSAIHVWSVDAFGTPASARPLTEGKAVHYRVPAVASDGRIALIGSRQGADGSLLLLPPDGTLHQVTTDESNHSGPQWMPGEREVAFVSNHAGGSGFWAIDVDSGRERLLFRYDELPAAPDDTQASTASPGVNIAFTRDFSRLVMAVVRNGTPNLWVGSMLDMRPRGDLSQRTFEREGGSYPAWSPDAQWIAYQCTRGTDTDVCVIGVDGTGRRQLTSESGQSWVGGWAADNDRILFAARRDAVWNVTSVSRSTGAIQTLTDFTEPRIYVRYPRWDASQNRVIFERSETTSRILAVDLSPPRNTTN